MTEDERQRLLKLEESVTVLAERVEDIHDLFLKPPLTGGATMAERLQELLNVKASVTWTMRAFLYLAAAVTTITGAYAMAKGVFWEPPKQ